jgi:putative FmdB family regulatory protein
MPIYAYKCDSCGHAKDVLQKMSDPLLTACPSCGKSTFSKQVTAAGFQLKGSGWYVTDFKGGSTAGAAGPTGAVPSDAGAPAGAAPSPAASGPAKSDSAATPASSGSSVAASSGA